MTMKRFFWVITTLSVVALFASCKPEEPNKKPEKSHDEATHIIYTFTPGEITEIDGVFAKAFTADKDGKTIITEVKTDEKTGKLIPISQPVALTPNQWYKLTIVMKNFQDVDLTEEIMSEAERPAHQFFFIPRINGNNLPNPQSIVDYRYGDMDFATKEFVREAVGINGYIKIMDAAPDAFDIQNILCHVPPPGTKLDKDGKPYPFYNPDPRILVERDVDLPIPFIKAK